MPDIGKAYIQVLPSSQGIQGALTKALSAGAGSAGAAAGQEISRGIIPSLSSAGTEGGSKLGSTLVKAFIGFGVASKLKDVIASGLSEGGALQQSLGGVEAIFGDSADKVKNYAKNAWNSVGISANEYMENVTSFSAALINSMGGDTNKAAEVANTALMDMGDNANRFGTDMASIQAAYQGFAKQNYTMLDNLKLGYGGTKTEMERLLADAEKFSGVHYDLENLGDVYEAIHVIQEELNVTGTTANEAASTLSGSAAAMKAAWKDLLGNMAIGEGIGSSLMNLTNTVMTYLTGNLFPMIGNIISTLPAMLGGLIGTLLPQLIQTGTDMIRGISSGITSGIPEFLANALPMILEFSATIRANMGEFISAGLDLLLNIVQGIANGLPSLIAYVPQIISNFVNVINDNAPKVLETGKKMLKAIVEGIINAIPALKENAMNIVNMVVDIWTAINWLQLGKDVISLIKDGFILLKNTLPELLKNIGTTALNWLKSIDWVGLGRTVINFIANGIRALLTAIPNVLRSIGSTALSLFRSIDWAGLGRSVINFIVNGIRGLITSIPNVLKSIGSTAMSAVKSINWYSVGSAIINGIVSGIKAMGSAIANTLLGFAKSAWQSAKNFLGIGSPSKLFADTVGAWIPPGIAVGIESTKQVALDAMDDLNNEIATSIEPSLAVGAGSVALNNATANGVMQPNYQIIVNNNVDGTPLKSTVGDFVIKKISSDEFNAMRFQGAY